MTRLQTIPAEAAQKISPVNILLVDDEARNLEALESILTSPAYCLVRARSAQEALLALIDGEFAAIVLDIQMPGTSGIELANIVKHRKKTRHIPIIFLTAYYQEDKDILQGYEAGAVDYLTKPLDPKILRSKIEVLVELFQKTRELATVNHAMELEIIQRQRAEEALRLANAELESRVHERTGELTQVNAELRSSNAAVHDNARRYSQLINSLPAAVYTTDAQGYVTLYNAAAVALWGRKPEVGTDLWCGSYKIYHPDGSAMALADCPMARTLRDGHPVRGEEIIVERPDGSRRNVLPYPDPIRDAAGKIVGAVNVLLDITENRRVEETSRRLAAIVESSADAIISKDLNSIVNSWNQGAELLYGYTAEEIIGRPLTILIPSDRSDEESNILDRIKHGERVEHFETVRQRKDGSLVEVSLTISPMKDARGRVVGASHIGRDITEQKQAERALERAHQEVMAASRAKDDFLAALSHELRTPLNPVLLIASEAARDAALPPAVREDFAAIVKNVTLEARLIDDLLDLTHISRGKLTLRLDAVDIHTVLQDAIAIVRPDAERKQLNVKLHLDAERHVIQGDSVRLQQVFWNVLKNALKFTPEHGTITVETRALPNDPNLVVTISDTGLGITAAELPQVFDAFTQGEHASLPNAHRFGGLGLGLAITRTLVESHHGNINAASAGRDRGATFTIALPLPRPEALQSRPKPSGDTTSLKSRAGLRILLVEDHEPTRTALSRLLSRRQHQIEVASSGAEALQLANHNKFDLVISDIGLPDLSGFDLMIRLRAEHQLEGIALTGYGMEYDVERSQVAGFLAHLTKPIHTDELDAAILRARQREALPRS